MEVLRSFGGVGFSTPILHCLRLRRSVYVGCDALRGTQIGFFPPSPRRGFKSFLNRFFGPSLREDSRLVAPLSGGANPEDGPPAIRLVSASDVLTPQRCFPSLLFLSCWFLLRIPRDSRQYLPPCTIREIMRSGQNLLVSRALPFFDTLRVGHFPFSRNRNFRVTSPTDVDPSAVPLPTSSLTL